MNEVMSEDFFQPSLNSILCDDVSAKHGSQCFKSYAINEVMRGYHALMQVCHRAAGTVKMTDKRRRVGQRTSLEQISSSSPKHSPCLNVASSRLSPTSTLLAENPNCTSQLGLILTGAASDSFEIMSGSGYDAVVDVDDEVCRQAMEPRHDSSDPSQQRK